MTGRAKSRGNGEGSIYQRADGKWCAAVSLERGKRKVLYGRTRKEVADKLNDALRDAKRGLPLPSARLSMAKHLADWLEQTVKPRRRAHTYDLYEIAIRCHLTPELGSIPLAKLTPQDVHRLQASMAAKGLSPATIGVARAVLSGALAQAEKWGLVSRNVVRLVDPPAAQSREPKVLTPEQATALTEAAKGEELEHLFTTMLATGLRIGEALGLQWRNVDLETRVPVLYVRQQAVELKRVGRRLDEPKSQTGKRPVPLIRVAVEALRAQHDRQAFVRRTAGDLWTDNDLVFPDELGGLLPYHRAAAHFKRLCARAGIQGRYTPHCLRHSAGTYLTAAGVPDRVVMEILGHSSPDMTRHYQHVVGSMLEDAGRRLDAFFPSARAASE
jgi:integrase